MPLNIKNAEVEKLAAEVATLAKESKTEAIRIALLERRARLRNHRAASARGDRMERFLREHVWRKLPAALRGKVISEAEREEILGFGPQGY